MRTAIRIFSVVFALSSTTAALGESPTADATSAAKKLSAYDEQIKPLLAKMTLQEKIGQMTQPDQDSLQSETDIETFFVGSILSGGNSDPQDGNTLEAWTALYLRCQKQAMSTRLGIPLLYGVDAVHGHNNVIGAVIFPHNLGLGCTGDPELIREISEITAKEVRATGIEWTFAPCITVPQDERWGRTYEGYSEDPKIASELGEAAVFGLQGPRLSDDPQRVLGCAKHFLGDGGTRPGTGHADGLLDQGDMQGDEEMVRRMHLFPYYAAVDAGVGTIMPSYSSWNGKKMSGHKYLMTDVLKGELGFEGFLISDYNAIDQVTPDYKEAIEQSINAGMDMVMVPSNYANFTKFLEELVNEGRVPMSRIDDAVTRILRVKCAMGLLDDDYSPEADPALQEAFGSAAHRDVARRAVQKSLVLLKDNGKAFPIAKGATKICVAGKCADDIGNQCGGWTIDWQGKSGEVTTGGTTIVEAIRSTAADAADVTFSEDGKDAADADVAIVVIGEKPYAEFMGDSAELVLDPEDVATIKNVTASGTPMVVVLVSGRPLIINDTLDAADAFIAAWLPGTEGQGVADVLFGDYKPTGKLSITWPSSVDQIPLNSTKQDDSCLFPIGFGL
ncbi:Periplasmic beta-glucosidase precursor [Planctomycetes bacterium CA13]|uniref:beta-glucosidase n=1 Tax=Novipirellula herctigrandis TaxID=2527986 RepID=A0A5C5YW02_9BACT|nr:Periplasmic beta-glucosidase precursor [Planctomycetes bacterium CA13]